MMKKLDMPQLLQTRSWNSGKLKLNNYSIELFLTVCRLHIASLHMVLGSFGSWYFFLSIPVSLMIWYWLLLLLHAFWCVPFYCLFLSLWSWLAFSLKFVTFSHFSEHWIPILSFQLRHIETLKTLQNKR